MIKGVIFDLGRTLMYLGEKSSKVDELATAALIDFLNENSILVDRNFTRRFRAAREQSWRIAEQTELEQTMEVALHSSLRIANGRAFDGLLLRAIEKYFEVRERFWLANAGAVELLKTLSACGLRLGAISNSEHDGQMLRGVYRLGFSSYLNPIITSAKAKWRKPNPRIFHLIADEWNLSPGEIVMVGDSLLEDIYGAHRAGIRGILIEQKNKRAWQSRSNHAMEYGMTKPDATISSLEEVVIAIDQVQNLGVHRKMSFIT